jgi:hypothetical protein
MPPIFIVIVSLSLVWGAAAPPGSEDPDAERDRKWRESLTVCRILANPDEFSGRTVEFTGFLEAGEHGLRLMIGEGTCAPARLGDRSWLDSIAADFAPTSSTGKASAHVERMQALLKKFSSPNPRRVLKLCVAVRGRIEIARKDEGLPGGWRGFGPKNEMSAMIWIEDIAEQG